MELFEEPSIYERIIHTDEVKGDQVRLTVNTFRGVEYISLRKFYLDFHEEWKPTRDGVTMPIDFTNSRELFIGLTEILSLAESRDVIEENFKDLLVDLYSK